AELTAVRVPQLDRPVPAAGGNGLAVRAEDHAPDPVRVSPEGGAELTAPGVPQLDRLIRAAGGQVLTVRAEHHASDGVRVVCGRGARLTAPPVPQFDRLVHAAGGQGLPVRAERHGPDAVSMFFEGGPFQRALSVLPLAPAVIEPPGEVAFRRRVDLLVMQ